jgi:hypothetical protein
VLKRHTLYYYVWCIKQLTTSAGHISASKILKLASILLVPLIIFNTPLLKFLVTTCD